MSHYEALFDLELKSRSFALLAPHPLFSSLIGRGGGVEPAGIAGVICP